MLFWLTLRGLSVVIFLCVYELHIWAPVIRVRGQFTRDVHSLFTNDNHHLLSVQTLSGYINNKCPTLDWTIETGPATYWRTL